MEQRGELPKLKFVQDGEYGYKGKVEFGKHIKSVLVPATKVKMVQDYLKEKGINVPVLPIEIVH